MAGAQISVVNALNLPRTKRKLRSPQHKFNVKSKPFEITPVLIAPVLPGETMTNALLQSRVVSDPIKDPLIGWHLEYMLFYVSIPAIASYLDDPDFINMFIDPSINMTYTDSADQLRYYNFKNGATWLEQAYSCIVDNFFRDEKDLSVFNQIENYAAAYADLDNNVFQSAKEESATGDDMELPGVDEIEDAETVLAGYATHYQQWEIMRDMGLSNVTFEDYLRSAGVSVADGDVTTEPYDGSAIPQYKHKPELLRHVRQWTYPTNHIDPTDGSPTSAVSWSIAERADKHRFFKYPGFIVGVSIARPKLYLGAQKGAAVGLLTNAVHFMPPVLQSFPYTSLLENLDSATDGILRTQDEDYWLDLKDLFLYGDQFFNHSMATGHAPALPAANAPCPKFLTEAMIDALFVTAGSEYIKQDGVVSFNILSRLEGTTND